MNGLFGAGDGTFLVLSVNGDRDGDGDGDGEGLSIAMGANSRCREDSIELLEAKRTGADRGTGHVGIGLNAMQ